MYLLYSPSDIVVIYKIRTVLGLDYEIHLNIRETNYNL